MFVNIDLKRFAKENAKVYQTADPFPNIVIDNFFEPMLLDSVLDEFPRAEEMPRKFENNNEKKLATLGESTFKSITTHLMHFMNSEPVLLFLQELTGIKETLIGDPYFEGGGCHQIVRGGFLKVHADFNKHGSLGLDRRINLLIYLNKDWKTEYGGYFELWNKSMTKCEKKVLPIFNRVAIFSTTSTSWHGHPDPLACPLGKSRKSLALYYYSNGRPKEEQSEFHSTIFKERP